MLSRMPIKGAHTRHLLSGSLRFIAIQLVASFDTDQSVVPEPLLERLHRLLQPINQWRRAQGVMVLRGSHCGRRCVRDAPFGVTRVHVVQIDHGEVHLVGGWHAGLKRSE